MLAELDKPTALAKNEGIEQVEAHMLNQPQIDCPVAHHFGPGIYVREVTLPAGIIAVGHTQKFEHLNIMLTGKVAIVDDGSIRALEAPLIFTGKPGRKVGYILETCVWQNVYATDETDIDKLESHFLDKSETWQIHEESIADFRRAACEEDRVDFISMLEEVGINEVTVRKQSMKKIDQIKMPSPWDAAVQVRKSDIEGKGLFLGWPVEKGAIIAPARLNGMRTPAGRFTNHAKTPNCEFVMMNTGDIYLVAKRPIHGCRGGDQGEELTVDYRQALALSGIGGNLCQG